MRTFLNLVLLAVIACASSGCAVDTANRKPLTTDQMIKRCVAGTLVAGLLCAAAKGGRAGAICAGVVAGACGIWMAYNNKKDKERIAAAKLRALQEQSVVEDSWQGDDGRVRRISVSTRELPPDTGALSTHQVCRMLDFSGTIDGQAGTANHSEEVCRAPDGRWLTKADLSEIGT